MEKKRKIYLTYHPKFNVIFTIGEDSFLRVWNADKHTQEKAIQLDGIPTSIAC